MEGKITMSSREFQRMRVFREVAERRMPLTAKLIDTDARQLALERVADYVAYRTVRLHANLIEQLL